MFDLKNFSWDSTGTLDAFCIDKKESMRVASIKDLKGFRKVGENLLIREADQAFWELQQNSDGSYTIERIVDDTVE